MGIDKTLKSSGFVTWLHTKVPPDQWERIWWLAPCLALLILPLGGPFLTVLGKLGWVGAPRATQALILFSILGGPIIGSVVLWNVGDAGLAVSARRRAKWFAWLAMVGPLLTFLVVSWLANIYLGL